jgi:transposase
MSTQRKRRKASKPQKEYSEAFKRQVVVEFEGGLYTKAMLKRKYGIPGHCTLDKWLKKYGKLQHKSYPTKGRPMNDSEKQRLKELEKLLKQKDAELDAYKRFIDIAERELNIKIVKKSGTKQSKK